MEKFLITLLTALLFRIPAYSFFQPHQKDSTQINSETHHILWLNFGQFFRKEIMVSYQRPINRRFSTELDAGYKFSTGEVKPFTSSNSVYGRPFDYAERMPFSQGLYAGAALKIHFGNLADIKPYNNHYFSFGIFYRYRFYNHKLVNSQTPLSDYPENWASQQSLDLNIAGLKLLFGGTKDLFILSDKSRILVDYYYGFGHRLKFAKTAYDWKVPTSSGYYFTPPDKPTPPSDNPKIEYERGGMISFHAGLKIGVLF